jgi:hypothetical protein
MPSYRPFVFSVSASVISEGHMSTNARDLIELRKDDPTSAELRRIAANLIAAGVMDQRKGC